MATLLTKKHFIDAAAIVKNILDGYWTDDPPSWADSEEYEKDYHGSDYMRAVQTAEAFIMLFTQHNPRFDVNRFLIACGLMAKPAKAKR